MTKMRCCNNCGNEYEYKRVTSLYCSDDCRTSAWHQNNEIVATLYLGYEGNVYRIQVTEYSVWVENQTKHNPKLHFSREFHWVYHVDYGVWFFQQITDVLEEYEQLLLAQ